MGFETFKVAFDISVFHHIKASKSFHWLHAKKLKIHMHWKHQIIYGFAIKKGNQSFLNMLNIFISDKLYGENYFEEFMNKWYKKQGS